MAFDVREKVAADNLFQSHEVLNIKLSGDLRELFRDRGDKAGYHPLTLSYTGADNAVTTISIRSKTRGNFRRKMGGCAYPPVWLDFSKSTDNANTIFSGQDRLKLVMPCRGDEYVIREYLLYRIYNLVTEKSFRARLLKIETEDKGRKKQAEPFYGILLEDEKQMAARNGGFLVEKPMLKMYSTETDAFLKMAVFEYLIGNTDWSVEFQQNIRLLVKDSLALPVTIPYDFDHAGLVNAPYAEPAEELRMSSVRERRYRGYCINEMSWFNDVVAFYNSLKKDIYALYNNCTLIDDRYLKTALQYLDEFYATINDPKKLEKEFGYPCRPDGTGNVIIKGLDKE